MRRLLQVRVAAERTWVPLDWSRHCLLLLLPLLLWLLRLILQTE